MARLSRRIAVLIGSNSRNVAAVLIAGVWRTQSAADIRQAIKARPLGQQITIIAGAIGLLFAFSLFAAQFGWIGLLIFWLIVIALVN